MSSAKGLPSFPDHLGSICSYNVDKALTASNTYTYIIITKMINFHCPWVEVAAPLTRCICRVHGVVAPIVCRHIAGQYCDVGKMSPSPFDHPEPIPSECAASWYTQISYISRVLAGHNRGITQAIRVRDLDFGLVCKPRHGIRVCHQPGHSATTSCPPYCSETYELIFWDPLHAVIVIELIKPNHFCARGWLCLQAKITKLTVTFFRIIIKEMAIFTHVTSG